MNHKSNDKRPIYYRIWRATFNISPIDALGLVYNPNMIEIGNKYWKEQRERSRNT